MRLNKFLASATGISRREADEKITSGDVSINGRTAVLGAKVEDGDEVVMDEKIIKKARDDIARNRTVIMLNKPEGYVSSRNGQGRPTVYDLLPPEFVKLKTVGRLDQNSSGLILLTDDGDFAHRMTHPKFAKIKIYEIELDRPLVAIHQQMISDFGVELEDGHSRFGLTALNDARTAFRVEMSEGRNRQIRRTFKVLGYTVTRLHRTNFGPYALGGLKSGEFKPVEEL
jgi:23S rRNA pseudouridine2605 synthase